MNVGNGHGHSDRYWAKMVRSRLWESGEFGPTERVSGVRFEFPISSWSQLHVQNAHWHTMTGSKGHTIGPPHSATALIAGDADSG
ncbi:hypothetical protein BAUCODRAFT_477760 [Baudoinia panamericana UAMH 10762]|uniref:Uncharacterized protein n=1 Tax=Baudoinia panamericana (strain UAMH 10762) TaxID=717646 RepID=M2MY77_BAUPA|nr:uncharacterized protein BAUCODRAFT_477760 [Baudoinia panamericana UAMH 10762]EMC96508.1 hypothetical protein BAUCODRAFT_477760 [Baudoinia panamericana UAMH 10762]